MKESSLIFLTYNVTRLEFKLGENFGQKPMEMNIKISRSIENVNQTEDNSGTLYDLILCANVGEETSENAFYANVILKGKFRSEQKNNLLLDNATAMIFPYLRSVLSFICVEANIPPLILPTLNIIEYFNGQESNKA